MFDIFILLNKYNFEYINISTKAWFPYMCYQDTQRYGHQSSQAIPTSQQKPASSQQSRTC